MTRENDMVDNPRHPAPPVDPHFKPAPHAPIDPHSHTVYDARGKEFYGKYDGKDAPPAPPVAPLEGGYVPGYTPPPPPPAPNGGKRFRGGIERLS